MSLPLFFLPLRKFLRRRYLLPLRKSVFVRGADVSRMGRGLAVLTLALTIALPAGAAYTDYIPKYPETKEEWFGRSFNATSAKIVLTGFAVSGLAYKGDEGVRDAWVNHQRMHPDTSHVGDLLGTGVPGLLIGLTQYQFDRANGEAHLKAWAGAGVWTYALKTVAGRKRPGTSQNRQSWPSGHTSTAFATASSLHFAYGWKVGVPSYIVASGVALSRLADDKHWFSDTLAGAGVGVWMGYAYAAFTEISPNDRPVSVSQGGLLPPSASHIQLIPSFGNETFLLNLLSEF